MTPIKVLSLFDGISCGRIALSRAGIPVESYNASEIDKYAINVSKYNWPDIVHIGPEGTSGKLFFELLRLHKEINPKWFLYENVKMKKEYQDFISEQLGIQPRIINSSLVSAQNRTRLYWTNIPIGDINAAINILNKGLGDLFNESTSVESIDYRRGGVVRHRCSDADFDEVSIREI